MSDPKNASDCGHFIPKPEGLVKQEEEEIEEALPIQDQIENLRTKISLKERYNRVLKDELEESRQGAGTLLQDLYNETAHLRQSLMDAINAEKFAVQNALRTHREFQLAMTGKTPSFAIAWLEDKLFDNAKRLNALMNRLMEKRAKLEEAESMVLVIEKWPRPGSLPWEVEAHANFNRIENLIEAMKVKRETASILHAKYREIKYTLLEEKGKYAPNLRNLESQLNFHKTEMKNLQQMLTDAIRFKDEAAKTLSATEKLASENRKRRRKQMAKMKKAVQRVLDDNQVKKQPQKMKLAFETAKDESLIQIDIGDRLNAKKVEVEQFNDRARRLVETMRVPDLTHIPNRLKTVMELGQRLTEEQEQKERLRDLLIKQRDQLILVLCHFKYSGLAKDEEFRETQQKLDAELQLLDTEMIEVRKQLQKFADITLNIRLGVVAILERLDETKKGKRSIPLNADLKVQLKSVETKVKKLVHSVESLKEQFTEPTEKNYAMYIKSAPVPPRLVRVGSPVKTEESDEDEFHDLRLPGRLEMKARSAKFVQQAKLKLGLIKYQVSKPEKKTK